MANSGEVYVLVCKVMPEAAWEIMATGFGKASRGQLCVMRDKFNADSGSEQWEVLSEEEMIESRVVSHG